MKVILLEKVPNLGGLGDVARVRPGYARNYLFPQGKAERATPAVVADFEKRRAELEKRQAERQENLQKARDAVDGMLLLIPARASADGSLYGSITATAIAQALNKEKRDDLKIADLEIRRGQIVMPAGNLKEIGDHEISVVLDHGMDARIKVSVVSDDGQDDAADIAAVMAPVETDEDGADGGDESKSGKSGEADKADKAGKSDAGGKQ